MEAEDDGRVMQVSVVDEDEGVRVCLSVILSEEGRGVLCAPDGFEGREVLKAHPVDLLISDHHMPRTNGLDLLWWSGVRLPELSVVLMTGQEGPALATAAIACGALRIPVKPFPVEDLLLMVRQLRRATRLLESVASSSAFRE